MAPRPKTKSVMGKETFLFSAAILWNSLAKNFKFIISMVGFKFSLFLLLNGSILTVVWLVSANDLFAYSTFTMQSYQSCSQRVLHTFISTEGDGRKKASL